MEAVDGEYAEHRVIERQDAHFDRGHGVALILLAATLALIAFSSKRFSFGAFTAAYGVATAAWLFLRSATVSLRLTVVIALALRGLFLLPEPQLSNDVYRYLSDGRAFARGVNPYAYTPEDPRINHPEIRSIYPPHAQFLFAVVHELVAWRLLIIACDIAAVILLARRSAPLAFAYAASPLVILEGTWSGHVDAIAAVLLLVALMLHSGIAAAFAGGLKLIPLAAVPALLRKGERGPFLVGFLPALLVPFLPFLGGPIMPGMRDYATRWIFNSPVYSLVRAVVEQIPTKAIWSAHPLRFESISDFGYTQIHPDFLTRAVLAVAAAAGILLARQVTTAVALLILFSPAIHPWYWITLVPAAMIERSRWIGFAICAPFSYLLYTGAPAALVWILCYGVPVVWYARKK